MKLKKNHNNLEFNFSFEPEPEVTRPVTLQSCEASIDTILAALDCSSKKELKRLTEMGCSEFLVTWKHSDPCDDADSFEFNEVSIETTGIETEFHEFDAKLVTKLTQELGTFTTSLLTEMTTRSNWWNAQKVNAALIN
jgi:hypothetical protein